MKNWIQTCSDKKYDLVDPDPRSISVYDIAHALSQINRFTGHTRFPYSVAQHCVLCASMAPPEEALWALLHDAPEAYVGDVAAPLKCLLPEYARLESKAEKAICEALGYVPSDEIRALVKDIDLRMLMTEAEQLLGRKPEAWGISQKPYPLLKISQITAPQARDLWLGAYSVLSSAAKK